MNYQYYRPECKTEGTANVSMHMKVSIKVHVTGTSWRSGHGVSPFKSVKFVLLV